MARTIQSADIEKWLKEHDLFDPKSLPEGCKGAVLFLQSLKSKRIPSKLSELDKSLLKFMSELHFSVESSSGQAQQAQPGAQGGTQRRKLLDQTNVPKAKPAAKKQTNKENKNPKAEESDKKGERGKRKGQKDAELNNAMGGLTIQEPKGCNCKSACKTKVCGCRKKEVGCSSFCKCGVECVNKPLQESKPAVIPEENDSEAELSGEEEEENEQDEIEEGGSDSEDTETEYGKESVNWEKHLSNLVHCPKCKRTFFPARVETHMKVCKKI